MSSRYFWQSALVVLGLAMAAAASTVTVKFTSQTGNLGGPAQGVYYYPYVLSINGTQSVTVTCDDYFDEVTLGEQWQANEYSYSQLSNALFYNKANYWGESGTLAYQQAAWLISQFQPVPPNGNNINAAINFAIWDLFSPTAPSLGVGSGANTDSLYWLNAAKGADLTNFNFSNFFILTPANLGAGQPQEYIGETAGGNSLNPVPEPASLALMLGGLALGLGWAWRRQQASV